MTGIWVAEEVVTKERMNEKTTFQGTGAAISGLAITYPGMKAFCTATGSGFEVDKSYVRNTANTSWSVEGITGLPYLTLSTTIGDYTSPASAVATSEGTTFSDDFASDTWNDVGTDYGVSGGVLNWRAKREVADHITWKDLTGAVVSDTLWKMRFKLVLTTHTQSTGVGCYTWFVLSDNSSDGEGTAQDNLGMGFLSYNGIVNYVFATGGNGVALEPVQTGGFSELNSTVTRYVQLDRISATSFKVELFSDAGFTTSVGSHTAVVSASIINLRYFKIVSWNQSTSTFNGVDIGYIDDLQFWDAGLGVASATVDNNTATNWKSNSEANPAVYVDLSSAREIVGVALNIDKTATTVTSLSIRASTDTTFTSPENIIYVNISDFTDDTWRFLANNFLLANTRYVQIYGNETGVLSINEIKVRYGVTDLVKILTHQHNTRSLTSPNSFTDSN